MSKEKMKRRIKALEGVLDSFESELTEQREALQLLGGMMACRQVVMAGIPDLHIDVPIVQLDPDLPLPEYAKEGDAGMDLRSRWDLTLYPGERETIATGVALAIPSGFVGLVHPRSGLAAKEGATVLNAPGTLDAGFRGEVHVILHNTDEEDPIHIQKGDRIAQLVFQQFATAKFQVVDELPESTRGAAGFGSTGVA
jgi:dUTP pyrophosphatase